MLRYFLGLLLAIGLCGDVAFAQPSMLEQYGNGWRIQKKFVNANEAEYKVRMYCFNDSCMISPYYRMRLRGFNGANLVWEAFDSGISGLDPNTLSDQMNFTTQQTKTADPLSVQLDTWDDLANDYLYEQHKTYDFSNTPPTDEYSVIKNTALCTVSTPTALFYLPFYAAKDGDGPSQLHLITFDVLQVDENGEPVEEPETADEEYWHILAQDSIDINTEKHHTFSSPMSLTGGANLLHLQNNGTVWIRVQFKIGGEELSAYDQRYFGVDVIVE